MPRKFKDKASEERWQINARCIRLGLIRGRDRTAYYDMLWAVARVKSSTDMDSAGRKKVLAHLDSLGMNYGPAKRNNNDPKSKKIWSLWYQLKDAGLIADASAKGLRSEVKSLTDCDDLKFCTEAQKSHIIECLKQWLARAK